MFRYIDDVVDRIYPIELEIKDTTDADRSGSYLGTGTANPSGAPEFIPVFSGVCVTRSLVLCVCFVDHCLSFCPFFFWPLCCPLFFEIRILITFLVSSNYYYHGEGICLNTKIDTIRF